MEKDKGFINLLNHGHIDLIDHMGSDLSIVRAARVSYDAHWRTGEDSGSDTRLLNYLLKNRHNTPFEAVTFTFDVKAPIFVFRQWHRHRTQSYNELSARYRQLPNEMYVPEIEQITHQSTDNKQMRTEERHPYALLIRDAIDKANKQSYEVYEKLIDAGCPRELARGVLPFNTYSHMQCTMNLHNLLHFIGLRNHSHAQYEIRVYAQAMLDLIRPIVPITVAALEGINHE